MAEQEPRTILFIRSAPIFQCIFLLRTLMKKHPPASTKWVVILQSSTEKPLKEFLEPGCCEILKYDHGKFTYSGLKRLFAQGVPQIDMAYIPFNNPEGEGYFQVVRFFSSMNIPQVYSVDRWSRFNRLTFNGFVFRRIRSVLLSLLSQFLLLLALPVVFLVDILLFIRSSFFTFIHGKRDKA